MLEHDKAAAKQPSQAQAVQPGGKADEETGETTGIGTSAGSGCYSISMGSVVCLCWYENPGMTNVITVDDACALA
jgi:hypothetical protein